MTNTPRPWTATEFADDWHIEALPSVLVARLSKDDEPGYSPAPDVLEANARLIAAAPLMLEELEYVASGLAHIDTPWAKERLGFVQEVIAQAKGEA